MGRLDTAVTGGTPNLLGSLTAAARPFPENADWEAYGVSYTPEACGYAWVWPSCPVPPEVDKPLNEASDPVTFRPFLIEYNAQSCAGIPIDHGELEDRAKRGLAPRVSPSIASVLYSATIQGVANPSPSLQDSATNLTPDYDSVKGLVDTVAALLREATGQGLVGELWLHAPAWTLPYWLEAFGASLQAVGNVYKLGPHTVIFEQGYDSNAPITGEGEDVESGVDDLVGQAWLYVSGPIEIALGSVVAISDPIDASNARMNRANSMVAQNAIYRFDPCGVVAALAQVGVTPEAPTTPTYGDLILADENLLHYWPLQETEGVVARDYGPNTRDGVIVGDPILGAEGAVAVSGAPLAMTFDGATQWIELGENIPTLAALDAGPFTIIAWTNADAETAFETIAAYGDADGDNTAFEMRYKNNNPANLQILRTFDASVDQYDSTGTITRAAAHMVAVTVQADGTTRWYSDGALVSSSGVNPLVAGAASLSSVGYLFNRPQEDIPFDGSAAHVSIHGDALSSDTIAALYAAGTA